MAESFPPRPGRSSLPLEAFALHALGQTTKAAKEHEEAEAFSTPSGPRRTWPRPGARQRFRSARGKTPKSPWNWSSRSHRPSPDIVGSLDTLAAGSRSWDAARRRSAAARALAHAPADRAPSHPRAAAALRERQALRHAFGHSLGKRDEVRGPEELFL